MTAPLLAQAASEDLDLISELRYRRWARENYVAAPNRDPQWHPVVLQEMRQKDAEVSPTSLG